MNPAQFAPSAPSYPRTRTTDAAKLVAGKAGAIGNPDVTTMDREV
jgi:pantothenate synthetase